MGPATTFSESPPAAAAEVFVARQPILNADRSTYGYELLYRSHRGNAFDGTDAAAATARVISNSYLTIGLDQLVGGNRAFINFDRASLVGGLPAMLPQETVVVEILETVQPDSEVLAACEALKKKGYLLALDDVVGSEGLETLLGLTDIVKVDFRGASSLEIRRLARHLSGATLLAEKVETYEEFERARQMGFRLFQGYFFSRPEVVSKREIPGFKLNYLRILKEVGNLDLDFERIEEGVKREASLVHKLLRYVNSAHFGCKRRVDSIRHALALLGETEIRRWISLATMAGLASDKPAQLVVEAMTRGRFCELMSGRAGLASRAPEMFLLGLYSLLDALLDRPMKEVVDEVSLTADVRSCLLGEPAPVRAMLDLLALAEAAGRADWDRLGAAMLRIPVPLAEVNERYLEAVRWAGEVFRAGD